MGRRILSFPGGSGGSSGGGNAFGIIQTDAGTSPVAGSPSDTLRVTGDGVITTTGDSESDTLTITLSGTVPIAHGGTNNVGSYRVQGLIYYDGDSDQLRTVDGVNPSGFVINALHFDKTNSRIGLLNETPSGRFDYHTSYDLDPPAIGGASLSTDSCGGCSSYPPPGCSPVSLFWRVYSYRTIPGSSTKYLSSTYLELTATTACSCIGGSPYHGVLDWDSVPGVDGYFITTQNDIPDCGFGFTFALNGQDVGITNHFDDFGTGWDLAIATFAAPGPYTPSFLLDDSGNLTLGSTGAGPAVLNISSSAGVLPLLNIKPAVTLQSNYVQVLNPSGAYVFSVTSSGRVGINTSPFLNDGQLFITSPSNGTRGLVLKGATSQAVNLFEIRTSLNASRSFFDGDGNLGVRMGNTTPQAYLAIGAGTATAGTGPLRFSPSTSVLLSSPVGGMVEVVSDKIYYTIPTGSARKEFTLNDTALTSGRVPFLTTNGRLTDSSNMTFSVDTLTVTKIGATQFTGNINLNAVNIATDTATGTRIGGSATQKLGFWNHTPVVQPANTDAIDTLLVNVGFRASGGVANFDTDIKAGVVGKGLYVKEGSNATMGVATLVGGTVTVSTTKVTASSRIQLSIQSLGTVAAPKAIGTTARVAGTSFTITSADATDTSVIAWMIVEPA